MTEAAQLHTLLNLVVTEDRTGILAVRVRLSGPVEGLRQSDKLHSFSFLFQSGRLVSARLGPYLDYKVLELIPVIASVAKARWTPMRADAITVTEASLSTETLAELIHNATAISHTAPSTVTPLVSAAQREGQILKQRAQKVFAEVFGANGHALLIEIVKKGHPESSPVAFLHRCIDQLAPYLGHTNATNLMVPPKER